MEPGKLSMGFPSHKYFTIFYFPLGDPVLSILAYWYCRSHSLYPSLYSTASSHTVNLICTRIFRYMSIPCMYHSASQSARCVPRICLNSCGLVRAESTKRQALILGSPRFETAQAPPQFCTAKLRRYAEPFQQIKRERNAGCDAPHKMEGRNDMK
jgi:hypothetical protein